MPDIVGCCLESSDRQRKNVFMRVVWLDINSSYSHSNLAFPALHANLSREAAGAVEWRKVSGVTGTPVAEMVMAVCRERPDAIMATAWLFNHRYLLDVLSDVKAMLPGVRVLLGGPEFLGTEEENEHYLRSHPFVDFVFRGDGEAVFEEILHILYCLCKDGDLKRYVPEFDLPFDGDEAPEPDMSWLTPGLCFIDSDGCYYDGGMACVKDFKSLRAPEESEFFDWSKPFVQLETSRGCFNTCAFCVSGIHSGIQNLPVGELRRRLDNIVSHGVREIRVLDRTFNAAPSRAVELLGLFREYAGRLRFHIEVHPAFLSDKVLEEIKSLPSGLIHVEVGVQSLSDRVLDVSCRKGSAAATLDGIRRLVSCGLFEVHSDLIIGLPEYSYRMLLDDTLRLMAEGVSEIQIETLKCLPGTRMRDEAAELGLVYSRIPPYQVLRTDWIGFEDIRKAMMLSSIVDVWFNDSSSRAYFMRLLALSESADGGRTAFLGGMVEFMYGEGMLDKVLSRESRWLKLYEYCRRQYEFMLPDLAVAWVCVGLSLKKEPACPLVPWKFSSPVANPVFVDQKPTYSYYYADCTCAGTGCASSVLRRWICYDRETRKVVFERMYNLDN